MIILNLSPLFLISLLIFLVLSVVPATSISSYLISDHNPSRFFPSNNPILIISLQHTHTHWKLLFIYFNIYFWYLNSPHLWLYILHYNHLQFYHWSLYSLPRIYLLSSLPCLLLIPPLCLQYVHISDSVMWLEEIYSLMACLLWPQIAFHRLSNQTPLIHGVSYRV